MTKIREVLDNPRKGYYERLAQAESSNRPTASSSTSSAKGLYQFTEGTWKGIVDDLGLDYTLNDRLDPKKSKVVLEQFTKNNEAALEKKLGRKPTDSELHLAHLLGATGANRLLENPNASVTDVVSEGALKANKSVFYNSNGTPKKASDVYKWSENKINSPSIKTKSGDVNISGLDQNLLNYISTLEPEYQEMMLATSGNDSEHTKGSRHYDNRAVDLRFNQKLYDRVKQDPNRMKYGVTLLDPGHGTAAHLHMSIGEGTENKKDVWMDPHSDEAKKIAGNIDTDNSNRQAPPQIGSTDYTPMTTAGSEGATYTMPPALEEAKEEKPLTEAQIKKLFEQERQKQVRETEKRFVDAFKQQDQPQQEEYIPQNLQEDVSNLYQYIDIESLAKGGKLNKKEMEFIQGYNKQ